MSCSVMVELIAEWLTGSSMKNMERGALRCISIYFMLEGCSWRKERSVSEFARDWLGSPSMLTPIYATFYTITKVWAIFFGA